MSKFEKILVAELVQNSRSSCTYTVMAAYPTLVRVVALESHRILDIVAMDY